MKAGQKEKMWAFAGLGLALIGGAWLALSIAGAFDGMAMMMGYFLGAGLVLAGLIIAGVYFFRWRRIRKLMGGEGVLVRWPSGDPAAGQVILSPDSALVDGRLYLWGIAGTRLENVQIEGPHLQITIGEATQARDPLSGSYLWQTKKLSIPIPPGQELAAQRVLEQLKSRLQES
jgi:hypothetical protein